MPAQFRFFSEAFTTGLGLVLAAAPLALWIAPTVSAFLTVLVVTGLAALGLCLLDFAQGEKNLLTRLRRSRSKREFPEKFVIELHKHMPLTDHHRRLGDPIIRRKMDEVKQHLND